MTDTLVGMRKKFLMPNLRAWREHRGKRQDELAEAISRVPAVISRIERQLQPMPEDLVARAAAYLGLTPDELINSAPEGAVLGVPRPIDRSSNKTSVRSTSVVVAAPATLPLDLPLRGVAAGSQETGGFSFEDTTDYVRRPPGLAGANKAYSLQIVGHSMEPRYEQGDLIFVNPARLPKAGDDIVVVVQRSEHGDQEAFVKRLVKQTSDRLVCKQHNPVQEIEWPIEQVVLVHRIVPAEEALLG